MILSFYKVFGARTIKHKKFTLRKIILLLTKIKLCLIGFKHAIIKKQNHFYLLERISIIFSIFFLFFRHIQNNSFLWFGRVDILSQF